MSWRDDNSSTSSASRARRRRPRPRLHPTRARSHGVGVLKNTDVRDHEGLVVVPLHIRNRAARDASHRHADADIEPLPALDPARLGAGEQERGVAREEAQYNIVVALARAVLEEAEEPRLVQMQVATLPGYQHLVGAKGHERQALRRRRGEGVGCLQCCEEREDSSRRHCAFVAAMAYDALPDARAQQRPQRWMELAAVLKNMPVGKRTRNLRILGLRVGCYAVVQESRRRCIASVLQGAS